VTVVTNQPLRVPHIGTRAARVAADPGAAWRSDSTIRKRAYARRRGLDITRLRTTRQLDLALEKVVGEPDFLPGRWIRRARAAAEAVARIKRADGEFGTGFLVTPWLLMTNHHVLETADVAAGATATFRYEENDDDELQDTVRLALQPERCFVTSPVADLDLTLVAVAPTEDGQPPGATFGCIPAQGKTGKALVGQPVNIVQHPDGRPRLIAIRHNLLLSVDDARTLTYSTDTRPGSSGAPVLNDRWELVALHHSSATTAGIVGNIGIRASAIVSHIRGLTEDPAALAAAGGEAAGLLEEFLRLGHATT
jgi:endonuclease G